jgi:hypothetical protein
MGRDCGQNGADRGCATRRGDIRTGSDMSAELLALLRYRIASRYYDEPAVLDQIARAILRERAR